MDLIDRTQAIQEMMDEDVDHAQGKSGREVIQILMDMDSAQPEIIRCKECKLSPWRPMRFNDPAQTMEVCTFTRDPSGFCAWGERRQEEQDE